MTLQLADYREALGLLNRSPEAALERMRAHRRRWKNSTILHEVDLQVIRILRSLGRKAEAQREAQDFLNRHPGSARVAEVRNIAGLSAPSENTDAGVIE